MKKESVLDSIAQLPDEFSIEEVVERLIILEKIEKAHQDIATGNIYSDAEVKAELSKWLS